MISEGLTERAILEQRLGRDKVGSYVGICRKNILSRRKLESKNPEAGHLGPVQGQRGRSGVRKGTEGMRSQRQGVIVDSEGP